MNFHFIAIATTYFQATIALNFYPSLFLDEIQQKDGYLTLTIVIDVMELIKGK